ncbi:AAA domain-containing protein [Williamsoniiplasma luminosum]|uniref:AAA domain-containing protein n=1 Tax=Williamsoniiplasma luminosum TaxID=214888 RepID=UPI00046F7555|nr:AAA domain-containing protein [Williamsoniiplasma luminosum]
MTGIQSESKKSDKKYTRLLNNLLDIKGRDQNLHTKVNNIDSFDMTTKFSKTISNKIINQKQFTITLNEIDILDLITKVKTTDSPEIIIDLYAKYKEKLFNTKKILLMDPKTFLSTKNELLESLEEKRQKEKTRWKQYRRKVLDSNIQENIWPLHVATLFISLKTPTKELYAPLLLKEVQLNIQDEDIQIKSEDTWKINEKLIFMLSEAGLPINSDIFQQDDEFSDLLNKILHQLNIDEMSIDLSAEFIEKKAGDVKNKNLLFHPGVILGMFKPSGGQLRKVMQKIIENDEIDEILDVEPNKNIYKENVETFVTGRSGEILRIQPSNFSQDKALISSLIQDTIIWGPPGTGKSQVIANIIANVLANNNKAIVMSQKKAALDVLKKRLGKIAPFALFLLNDNKMDKTEFYKPLQKFIQMVENSSGFGQRQNREIISKTEQKMLEIISRTKKMKHFIHQFH